MDGFLKTVYPQMRLVTVLEFCVEMANAILIFTIGALSVYLWMENIASPWYRPHLPRMACCHFSHARDKSKEEGDEGHLRLPQRVACA